MYGQEVLRPEVKDPEPSVLRQQEAVLREQLHRDLLQSATLQTVPLPDPKLLRAR